MVGSVYFTETRIIKVSAIDGDNILGYDLLKEEYVEVCKQECRLLTDSIISLLSNMQAQILVAYHLGTNEDSRGAILGIDRRTFYRRQKEYLGMEEPVNGNKKHLVKELV